MAMRKIKGKSDSKPPASAREPMTDSLETRKEKIRELLDEGDHGNVLELIKQSKENVKLVAGFLSDDGIRVREGAISVFILAVREELDISDAFEAMADKLSEDNAWMRNEIIGCFKLDAKNGTQKTREKIIAAIMKFMNSDRFRREADRNSELYLQMVGHFDGITKLIDQAEREAA